MARQEGVLPVSGSIGNLSFYHDRIHGYLVRRKGGASKEKIKNDPAFERTRENNSEFAAAQRAGKLIRTAVRTYLPMPKDSTIARRLGQRLLHIKDLDTTSVRGARTVTNGLQTDEGRELLSTVAFHAGYPLQDVLKKPFVFDASSGTFSIAQLIPEQDLNAPAAATHARVQCAVLTFDFVENQFTGTKTTGIELALDDAPLDLVLEVAGAQGDGAPEGDTGGDAGGDAEGDMGGDTGGDTGTVSLRVVSVVFLQEQNGTRYVLREGSALGVV